MSEPGVADLAAARSRRDPKPPESGGSLFEELGPEHLADLAPAFRRIELAPGEILWHQATEADGLYVLLSGAIQVSRRLPGERELELARLGPGDVLGELPLLGGGTRRATVRALEASSVDFLSRAEFEARSLSGAPSALELRRLIVAIACTRLRRALAGIGPAAEGAPSGVPQRALTPPRAYVSRLELFRKLDPGLVSELLDRGRLLSVARGALLPHAQGCYVTLNGAVEDVVTSRGVPVRVGFAGPGHAFGYLGLLDGEPAPATSIARERAVVLAIEPDDFRALMRERDARSRSFAAALAAELIRALEFAARAQSHLAAARSA